MDIGKFVKSYIVGLIATAIAGLNAWAAQKYGIDPHISAALVATPVLFGLALIAKHWHLDALAMSLEPDEEKPAAPPPPKVADAPSSVVAKLLPVAILLGIILGGCRAIDKATLQEFQSGEVLILKDMSTYIAADVAAGKVPPISQAALDAHLAKINQDPRSVDPAEEQTILAQFIAYLAADTKISSGTMKAWGGEVKSHLDLFKSVHR